MVSRNGDFNITSERAPIRSFSDLAHFLLLMSWTKFFAVLVGGFLLTNAFFAALYVGCGDCIIGARPGRFGDALAFSVQTMTTIGYGALVPRNAIADVLVAVQSMCGLLGFAVVTGLFFAKFARPTVRLLFSDAAVIRDRDGLRTLQFRVANRRGNKIVDANLMVVLVYDHVTREGERMRNFEPLIMARERSPVFALSWTGMHVIDDSSPLFGRDAQWMTDKQMEIIITLTGIDDAFNQSVHAQFSYLGNEILWNHRLSDVIVTHPDNTRGIDYEHFHDVFPL